MFGDIKQDEIDNYSIEEEISGEICFSTDGRKGMRYLDRVLYHLDGNIYTLKYRVRSKEAGSFIFDDFKDAAKKYNEL